MRWMVAVAMVSGLWSHPVLAMCDLSQVVGYTLVFGKTIQAYIQDGQRINGFGGCAHDRVLVFTDNTGVRCNDANVHAAILPKGYLFAKNANDMKLCVDDDMYNVAPAN